MSERQPVYGDPMRSQFDAGYNAGLNDDPYAPASIEWIQGYESGSLARARLGLGERVGVRRVEEG